MVSHDLSRNPTPSGRLVEMMCTRTIAAEHSPTQMKLVLKKFALEGEAYLRSFLEQARKVAKVAAKHIGGDPTSATIHEQADHGRNLATLNYSR